jgi:alkanesulfonate monooxygenase SsuD/methylene tetrahydromethanopterin reductase-like flavin-dependent oxidoreductase (luciferase family)
LPRVGGSRSASVDFRRVRLGVYIAVDEDAERTRRRVAAGLQRLYAYFGLSGLEAVAVSGPPDACAEGVREVAEAGAELILFSPLFDEAEQMERLAAEVVPKLS